MCRDAVGLKVVREICTRCPLIMTPELLQVSATAPAAVSGGLGKPAAAATAGMLGKPAAVPLSSACVIVVVGPQTWLMSGLMAELLPGRCCRT